MIMRLKKKTLFFYGTTNEITFLTSDIIQTSMKGYALNQRLIGVAQIDILGEKNQKIQYGIVAPENPSRAATISEQIVELRI